jgi:hypothetical protein
MLGWGTFFGGKPSAPLDDRARLWIEQRLRWLQDEFGADRLIDSPIILPTPQYFPDEYDVTFAAVQTMFERVCGYMDVSPNIVSLRVCAESNRPEMVNESGHALATAAGTYAEGTSRFIILLDQAQFSRPMEVVGTMAHELAHLRTLGENRTGDSYDNELLTDLTAVYFGFGIFLATAPRHWHSQLGYWPGTNLRKPEYMTLPMYGYALALIASIRFEEKPKWLKRLKRDARSEFKAAARYLEARQT